MQSRGRIHFCHCTQSTETRNRHTIIITIVIIILIVYNINTDLLKGCGAGISDTDILHLKFENIFLEAIRSNTESFLGLELN